MSAGPVARRGPLASALSAAAGWLVEPAQERPAAERVVRGVVEHSLVVAVVGLTPRCGTTTVARALGAELALRDRGGSCAVTATSMGGGVPLGLPAAARLARSLTFVSAGPARACGRLCLVTGAQRSSLANTLTGLAPLVVDVDDPQEASAAAAVADRTVVVASPRCEPGLAALFAESLARVGPQPLLVRNRSLGGSGSPGERVDLELPDSRLGARLALAGREARGELGRAIGELADRVGERR